MRLSAFGRLVQSVWYDLPKHYPRVGCDAFVIMPNHIHGVLILTDVVSIGAGNGRAGFNPAATGHGLPEIVRAFKTFSARRINGMRGTRGVSVWQRNYFEHVVRNEAELLRIREYVVNNPLQWELDIENPSANLSPKPVEVWAVSRYTGVDLRFCLAGERPANMGSGLRTRANLQKSSGLT
jgi:REP element-mobilizing transposase RayT